MTGALAAFVKCIIKQLLDEVFVISRIIKVSVRVIIISLNLRLQLITIHRPRLFWISQKSRQIVVFNHTRDWQIGPRFVDVWLQTELGSTPSLNRFTIISGNLANNVFRALHFHTSANNLANNYEPLAQIYLVIILSHKRSNLLNVSQFSLF